MYGTQTPREAYTMEHPVKAFLAVMVPVVVATVLGVLTVLVFPYRFDVGTAYMWVCVCGVAGLWPGWVLFGYVAGKEARHAEVGG
jgi:predicted membrane channel-forming protein YqfA (hemolysin III family)